MKCRLLELRRDVTPLPSAAELVPPPPPPPSFSSMSLASFRLPPARPAELLVVPDVEGILLVLLSDASRSSMRSSCAELPAPAAPDVACC